MRRFFPSLGDTGDWYRLYASADEVYLWRARLERAPMSDPSDALAVLAAFGKASDLDLSVQAICVVRDGDGAMVDVVLTSPVRQIYTALNDGATSLAQKLVASSALRERFPGLVITDPKLLQLTGPPDAVDFWRSHPTVWDPTLGQTGQGGPTSAFAKLEGVYEGVADEGPRARPWITPQPDLGPGPKQDDKQTVLWVMGGLVLAWLVVRSL